MKTDTYTKIIITVIAVALVKIAFQDIQVIKPLFAYDGINAIYKIATCESDGNKCAKIGQTGSLWISF
jgi:hypothetical protein